VRTAFLRDLRPVQPETIPDLDVAVRREQERTAVNHRIARAVPLLLGRSIVVGKSRPRRCRSSEYQRNKDPGFHVSFPNRSAAGASMAAAGFDQSDTRQCDKVMAMIVAPDENIGARGQR
jgi:hypothetical protein